MITTDVLVTATNRKEYLLAHPFAYQSGWMAAEDGYRHPVKLVATEQIKKQFAIGYEACMNNQFTIEGRENN